MSARVCAECGVPVRGGDGGVRAFGLLFCGDECANEMEERERPEEICAHHEEPVESCPACGDPDA